MKLPNGYGSIHKLPGNRRKPWRARVTTGWTEEGKQMYYVVGYFETRAKAMEALSEYNKNPIGEMREKTLGEMYEAWSKFKFGTISRDTVNNYKAAWKYLSVLEEQPICLIRKSHMQEVIKQMADAGLSRSSMEKVKTLAVILFNEAMDDNIVEKNFGSLIELPPSRKTKKPTFSDMEIKRLQGLAERDAWAGTILILIYTGMRIGELLALTKFNVDLQKMTITGGIKTEAGRDRVVPIHSKIREYIRFWYERPGSYLIEKNEEKINVDYYRKYLYYPTLEKAKVRRLVPHSTRHTFATLLSRAKAPTKDIQALIGHSDYAVTANTYTHPDVEELRSAIESI